MMRRTLRTTRPVPILGFLFSLLLTSLSAGCAPAQTTVPTQIRLSFGEDPAHVVRVVWQTDLAVAGSVADYGTTPAMGHRAGARRVTYAHETGVIHEATMAGLKPGTVYYYRVGDGKTEWSSARSFRTAPDRHRDFFFTAFGDHGIRDASRRNVENILAEQPAFHLIMGDISYANGNQPKWDDYFRQIEPLASYIPIMPTLGNHENETMTINGARVKVGYESYLARFALPGRENYYSWRYSNACFVAFNSDKFEDPDQLVWLDRTLAEARADKKVRWVIVYQHHPLYGTSNRRGNNKKLIATVEHIYDRHRVDLVLLGHDHHYERQFPIRAGQATSFEKESYPQGVGVLYVLQGGGGQSLYDFQGVIPEHTMVRDKSHGYLRISVPVSGSLVVEAKRLDGSLIERFEIVP